MLSEENEEGTIMKFIVKDQQIEADLGHGTLIISSDKGVGYRPVELLVSSVASCSGAVMRTILNKQRIDYEELSIEANVERNEKEANRVTRIQLDFYITGKKLPEGKLQKNLKIVRKHCGMLRSVEGSIEIEEQVILIDSDV